MLTILQTADGKRLTKVIRRVDGEYQKTSYDKCFRFNADTVELTSIRDLSEILIMLEHIEDRCVVRAIPTGDTRNIRRTLYADGDLPATLMDNPDGVQWIMLDFDKMPVASLGLTSNQERLDWLVSQMPPEFHDVTYHYQWTSSAGLDGWNYLSAHLFFYLDQPWFCRDLAERFREGDLASTGADAAVYTSNQIHYTAAPIFVGCDDPLGEIRSGLVIRESEKVKLSDWVRPAPPPYRIVPLTGTERFKELLGEIGPDYHAPIRKVIAHYVSTGGTDFDFLRGEVTTAIQQAPMGKNPKRDYLDRHYLDRLIKGAVRKFGGVR